MRTIIILAVSVFSSVGLAAPRVTLEAQVVGHYSTQKSKLFQTDKNWFCETELAPKVALPSEPSSIKLFPKSQKESAKKDCRDKAYLAMEKDGKKSLWSGCKEDPAARAFLAALAEDCKR